MRLIVAACLTFGLSGCASIYSVAVSPERNDIYGGVRLDARIISAAATDGRVTCGLDNCKEQNVWFLTSGAVCDLPLSLIADTLLLPYTIVAASDAQQRVPADVPRAARAGRR